MLSMEYDRRNYINGLSRPADGSGDKKRSKNYKLISDPFLHKDAPKVYRFDGISHGDTRPVETRDPRSRFQKLWSRRQPVDLPVPRFKYDEYYVGQVPPKEVTITNLNDNINKAFLENMCSTFGKMEEIKVYYHPKTKKHMGIAKIVFVSSKCSQLCVEKLNQTSKMGNIMNVFIDTMGKERTKLIEDLLYNKLKNAKPPPPPPKPSPGNSYPRIIPTNAVSRVEGYASEAAYDPGDNDFDYTPRSDKSFSGQSDSAYSTGSSNLSMGYQHHKHHPHNQHHRHQQEPHQQQHNTQQQHQYPHNFPHQPPPVPSPRHTSLPPLPSINQSHQPPPPLMPLENSFEDFLGNNPMDTPSGYTPQDPRTPGSANRYRRDSFEFSQPLPPQDCNTDFNNGGGRFRHGPSPEGRHSGFDSDNRYTPFDSDNRFTPAVHHNTSDFTRPPPLPMLPTHMPTPIPTGATNQYTDTIDNNDAEMSSYSSMPPLHQPDLPYSTQQDPAGRGGQKADNTSFSALMGGPRNMSLESRIKSLLENVISVEKTSPPRDPTPPPLPPPKQVHQQPSPLSHSSYNSSPVADQAHYQPSNSSASSLPPLPALSDDESVHESPMKGSPYTAASLALSQAMSPVTYNNNTSNNYIQQQELVDRTPFSNSVTPSEQMDSTAYTCTPNVEISNVSDNNNDSISETTVSAKLDTDTSIEKSAGTPLCDESSHNDLKQITVSENKGDVSDEEDKMSLSSISDGEEKLIVTPEKPPPSRNRHESLQLNSTTQLTNNKPFQQAISSTPNSQWQQSLYNNNININNIYRNVNDVAPPLVNAVDAQYKHMQPMIGPGSMLFGSPPHVMNYQQAELEEEEEEEQDSKEAAAFGIVLKNFVTELKEIMHKDLCKKMVENSAFKSFETWWDNEKSWRTNRAAVWKPSPRPVKPTYSSSTHPPEMSSTLASLFETQHPWSREGGLDSGGFGGFLGIRGGMPKMPSFKRIKYRPPSPEPVEDEDDDMKKSEESEAEDELSDDEASRLPTVTKSSRKAIVSDSDDESESSDDEHKEASADDDDEEDEEDEESAESSDGEYDDDDDDDDDESDDEDDESDESSDEEDEDVDVEKEDDSESVNADKAMPKKDEIDESVSLSPSRPSLSPIMEEEGEASKADHDGSAEKESDVKPTMKSEIKSTNSEEKQDADKRKPEHVTEQAKDHFLPPVEVDSDRSDTSKDVSDISKDKSEDISDVSVLDKTDIEMTNEQNHDDSVSAICDSQAKRPPGRRRKSDPMLVKLAQELDESVESDSEDLEKSSLIAEVKMETDIELNSRTNIQVTDSSISINVVDETSVLLKEHTDSSSSAGDQGAVINFSDKSSLLSESLKSKVRTEPYVLSSSSDIRSNVTSISRNEAPYMTPAMAEHNYFIKPQSWSQQEKMRSGEETDSADEEDVSSDQTSLEVWMEHSYCIFPTKKAELDDFNSDKQLSSDGAPVIQDEYALGINLKPSVISETVSSITFKKEESSGSENVQKSLSSVAEVAEDVSKDITPPKAKRKNKRKSKEALVDITDKLINRTDDKISRELAGLLTPIKPVLKYKQRLFQEERQVFFDIYHGGIDDEDTQLMKQAYDELIQSDDPNFYWLNDILWVNHPMTRIPDPLPPPRKKKKMDEWMPKIHSTGSSRSEGYCVISMSEKANYLRNAYNMQISQKVAEDMRKEQELRSKKLVVTSREARHTNRRLMATFADLESDLLKFNQLRFRKKQLRFARSSIHDWGLFALEPITAEEMVIEYVGQMVRQSVADEREKHYEATGIGSSYLFRVDSEMIIDATKWGNLSRFVNHSCNPNCYAKIITVESLKKIVIYSKRDIDVNEEITYDYKFPIEDEKIPCLCGASTCRGTLN